MIKYLCSQKHMKCESMKIVLVIIEKMKKVMVFKMKMKYDF